MAVSSDRNEDSLLSVGRRPVREALERTPGRVEKVLLQRPGGGELAELRRMAARAGVQVQFVPSGRLRQLARGVAHQGAAAIMAPVTYVSLDDLLMSVAPVREDVEARKPRLLVLDGMQDPFNFGAVLRSAVASGVAGVVAPRTGMAPLNAAAMKASAGAAGRIPIARTDSLAQAMHQLKERGYWVAGADARGEVSVWDMDWDRPMALVIGNEAKGIRPAILEACDYRVRIPMPGPMESLNASVAAGILLFAAAGRAEASDRGA